MNAARLGPNGRASSAWMYSSAVRPGLVLVDGADHAFAGDGLDAPEDVACVHTSDVDGGQ